MEASVETSRVAGTSAVHRLQERVLEANRTLAGLGLAVGTFGNVSEIDRPAGLIAIKPSGVNYREMKAGDITVLDLDGNVVHGDRRPSSDTPSHLMIYRGLPVGGICHTHSVHAMAWAQAGRDIPLLGTTHADYLIDAIPCCPPLRAEEVAGDYEAATGRGIVAMVKQRPDHISMALVAHHGAFTWADDADQAVQTAASLELIAQAAILTLAINPGASGPSDAVIDRHHRRKHGNQAYYGQPRHAE